METQFQADIQWLQNEVAKIKDAHFLERVKNLMKERPSAKKRNSELVSIAQESEEDIKAGRLFTREEVEKEVRKKLGL